MGYVGKEVDSIIRDLTDAAVKWYASRLSRKTVIALKNWQKTYSRRADPTC